MNEVQITHSPASWQRPPGSNRGRRRQRLSSEPRAIGAAEVDAQELTRQQRYYYAKKAAGLCTRCGCHSKAASGHTRCLNHLREMSKRWMKTCEKRIRQSLCVDCGKRPGFWGVACIICRQRYCADPLPSAARRALKEYRRAELKRTFELSQVEVRFCVSKLLAGGEVQGNRARALRLYTGLDDGRWRTYAEVGTIMTVSKEYVRKLVLPAKTEIERLLDENVPWRMTLSYRR